MRWLARIGARSDWLCCSSTSTGSNWSTTASGTRRLASAIRASDTLARLGGDEFAVLCQLSSERSAARIAEQLLSSLHEPVVLNGEKHVLSASIGIAINTGECSATDLLRDADAAMYHAEAGGGAGAAVFDKQMHERVLRRVRTESALRAALTNEQEILLHYQPQVSLRTGQIVRRGGPRSLATPRAGTRVTA
jgi:predicted signal transduction protein with EAL and GGDEF domain